MGHACNEMPMTPTVISLRKRLSRGDFRIWLNAVMLIVTISVATTVSVAARNSNHPVTAAVVFVIAVLINGSVGGLTMGLLAATTASIIYNFFIRYPVYVFGFHTIDDYVPLFALSITAIISGVLSGRLADKARAAEKARNQLERLLQFSSDLQTAINLGQVVEALAVALPERPAMTQVLERLEKNYPFRRPGDWRSAVSTQLDAVLGTVSETSSDAAGRTGTGRIDTDMMVSLLRMAIERCELLEEKAQADAILQSEQFKTALLNSLSHDLRTPLAAISASADGLIRYGSLLDEQSRASMLTTIQEQCARLGRFTQQIVSLARLEAGFGQADLEIVDLEEALGSVIATLRIVQPARRIIRQIMVERPLTRAQPALLEQVLSNVIENAVRYSPLDKDILVTLSGVGDMLAVNVIDQGCGIEAHDLPHVFERFYRGGSSVDTPGQGLGLSIAKTFVDMMGGRISVTSPGSSGRGTEVEIFLPQAPPPADE